MQTKSIWGTCWFSFSIRRKKQRKHIEHLWKHTVQILYLSTLANGGLNDSEAAISMSVTKKRENQPKQFEDTELLLKPGETVNTDRHRQQMINLNDTLIEKRPVWSRRHEKVIDKAPSHAAKLVKDTLTALGWEILPHQPYSPDLTPSDNLIYLYVFFIVSF